MLPYRWFLLALSYIMWKVYKSCLTSFIGVLITWRSNFYLWSKHSPLNSHLIIWTLSISEYQFEGTDSDIQNWIIILTTNVILLPSTTSTLWWKGYFNANSLFSFSFPWLNIGQKQFKVKVNLGLQFQRIKSVVFRKACLHKMFNP